MMHVRMPHCVLLVALLLGSCANNPEKSTAAESSETHVRTSSGEVAAPSKAAQVGDSAARTGQQLPTKADKPGTGSPFLYQDDIEELARRYAHFGASPAAIQSAIANNRQMVIEKYHKLLLAPEDVKSIDLGKMRPGARRHYLELIYWSDKSTKRTFLVTFVRRKAEEYLYRVEQDGEAGEFILRTNHQSRTLQDSLLANVNAYLFSSQNNRDRYLPNGCDFRLGDCQYAWAKGDSAQQTVKVETMTDYGNFTWQQTLSFSGSDRYKIESVFDKQGLLLHRAVIPLGKNKKYIAKEWVRIE